MDFEEAHELVRGHFPFSMGFAPYYSIGRVLLPPDFSRSALAVPLDGEYVVHTPLPRTSFPYIADLIVAQMRNILGFIEEIKPHMDFGRLPSEDVDPKTPYLPNRYFGYTDAQVLTGIIRRYKPRTYLEVGSGNSTRFARRAVDRESINCRIVSIDPNPRSDVGRVADDVITKSILGVDLERFDALHENDILFIDGSHQCFHGTDTVHIILNILPRLKAGVFVHFHDIFLPDEYPERVDANFWSEQYLLAAFLMYNQSFIIRAPVAFLCSRGILLEGASFWLQRTS